MIHVADLSDFENFLKGSNDSTISVTKLVDNMDSPKRASSILIVQF
ncbi:hypothetical protein PF005_g24703 [Phytophthora fragariae]|uniref:Uncharacterized protein n=1 Tax=Phytophthora fragariae TaxID=53985 RepID=A0A6A3H0U8_9STRA|nr:hypothetical protein PF003_g29686 [Phytophthora fragariae]KAE8923880.1 hypothetical protein PF009_g25876 [Phytophthora fragariae]KAE8962712.1 hypothetical protein PF011_g29281 [Phytophthora fragariae]KAE9069339.1 hypothetical protein PF006_g29596 [Phytophthora fragariae]KAE9074479.1 hypothetical protein PF010_g24660 [Phytophthora fragariae]